MTLTANTSGAAEIHKTKRKSDRADVVVKLALLGEKSTLKEEFKLLSSFNHPNIVKSIESFTIDGTFCMVMPSYSMGCLSKYFKGGRIIELWKNNNILKIFLQIVSAVKYLHGRKIIYGGINPLNC